ncbi:DUF3168 domain-containing protein [Bacillus atrophaeus]|uniref:DUF3168 domain-containing protein n=1 Tax=Bacillus atrophaeus TaxID=1452 RepID=UPI00077B0BF1|nr:DUF3168 domain-containing protein [Bacillus atrophaeus]KXZ12922.1 phage tail protein [Bacillus atrophaeus]MED4809532.1 DUF3168 domain-containing protein [Bacillus atrophaeus]GED03065.1 hypothetical protein BAT02nite_27090 [Bacillus atrophaeus]
MRSALWPLQAAIFERLSTDEELNVRVTGVFDAVSKDQQKPYVTMGDDDVAPFETKTSNGEEINVVLHCWSDYNGKKEAQQVLSLMLQALTNKPLEIEGFSLCRFVMRGMQVITDIDGYTRHGILRMRYIINN